MDGLEEVSMPLKMTCNDTSTGIYFTTSPEYALRYCKPSECLIYCYLILSNPFPVIHDDATSPAPSKLRFLGKSNHKNYGCHYVPIHHYEGMDFRPPAKGNKLVLILLVIDIFKGEQYKYDEIVIFQEQHILPKYIVHLQHAVELQKVISTPSKAEDATNWSVDEVCKWMKTLKLAKDYSAEIKNYNIHGDVLETMRTKDDWEQVGITLFGDVRTLLKEVAKLFPK